MTLTLTKHGHSCVRVSDGATTVVIDPGMFAEDAAFAGADAVLVTHEHGDHVDVARLSAWLDREAGLEIWTNGPVAELLGGASRRVHVVGDGDAFALGGMDVTVHGEWHEVVHPDIPRAKNVCFLVGGAVFHPGDSFTLPGAPVPTLLLPIAAPWCKAAEVIDYAREVRPSVAYALHDAFLNDAGLGLMGRVLGEGGVGIGTTYRRLDPGTTVTL